MAVVESNLDDATPQVLGFFMFRAMEAGALDVFHTPIQMKKNRPGVLLTVLCAEGDADKFADLMLRHTSAFGVRLSTSARRKLKRRIESVETKYGKVEIKLGLMGGKVIHAAPEYESCRRLALEARVPLQEVYNAALQAARSHKT